MWENNKRGSFVMERFRTTRDHLSQDLSNFSILLFFLPFINIQRFKTWKQSKVVILPTLGWSLTSELRGEDRIWEHWCLWRRSTENQKAANCHSYHRWHWPSPSLLPIEPRLHAYHQGLGQKENGKDEWVWNKG